MSLFSRQYTYPFLSIHQRVRGCSSAAGGSPAPTAGRRPGCSGRAASSASVGSTSSGSAWDKTTQDGMSHCVWFWMEMVQTRWGTHGWLSSIKLFHVCFSTMMIPICMQRSMRQPLGWHCTDTQGEGRRKRLDLLNASMYWDNMRFFFLWWKKNLRLSELRMKTNNWTFNF